MKNNNLLLIVKDTLEVILSAIILCIAMYILMYSSHEYTTITFFLITNFSLIIIIKGICDLRNDYIKFKKYLLT